MPAESTKERISTFIKQTFPAARRRDIRDDDDLLEEGILDSVGVLDVVGFIEREFAVAAADEDLVPENFRSLARLAAFVDSRSNAAGGRAGGR
jgi:acyl carrier protein